MNLDVLKMRRLSQSGIDINKMAPNLFDSDHTEYQFNQKQGGVLDWFIPEYEKPKKKKAENSNMSSSLQ